MENKLILTDCDGILLEWRSHFDRWMEDNKGYKNTPANTWDLEVHYPQLGHEIRNYVKEFNNSSWIIDLDPIEQAQEAISTLELLGYKLVVVSALSSCPYSARLREINLTSIFGEDVFEDIICVESYSSKKEILHRYNNTGLYWIEDNWVNAITGADEGLNPIVYDYSYNRNKHDDRIKHAKDWGEILDIIL